MRLAVSVWPSVSILAFQERIVTIDSVTSFRLIYRTLIIEVSVLAERLERWTCDTKGRGYESRPFRFQLTTLGKLFTHMCQSWGPRVHIFAPPNPVVGGRLCRAPPAPPPSVREYVFFV